MAVDPTNYRRMFLDLANPLVWGKGSSAFPRNRDCPHVNSKDAIRRGYRSKNAAFVYYLERFAPSTLKHHLTRADGSYLLGTYDDFVWFIPFDLDIHPRITGRRLSTFLCDPDELDESQHAFLKRCQEVHGIFQSLGLQVIWYRSPGNIYNDQHVQGVNGVIVLDGYEMRQQLAEYCRALVERHDLQDVEFHWLTGKLFRFPFQRHMCVCDPETLEPVYPANPKCRYWEFATGCEHLNGMVDSGELTDLDVLIQEWKTWRAETMKQSHSPAEMGVQAMSPAPAAAATAITDPTAAPATPKKVRITRPADSVLLSLPDTFQAATEARICSELTIRYRGDWPHFEEAVADAKAELKRIRPMPDHNPHRLPVSNTCTDAALLDRTIRRWMNHYFTHYDPTKANSKSAAKEIEDSKRFAIFRNANQQILLHVLGRRLSYAEQSLFKRFWELACQFNGRVAAKALYDSDKALCSKTRWFKLKKKLSGLLDDSLQSHSVSSHHCRQWGLTPYAMSLIAAAEAAATIVAEENKEEIVYGSPLHEPLGLVELNASEASHDGLSMGSGSTPAPWGEELPEMPGGHCAHEEPALV